MPSHIYFRSCISIHFEPNIMLPFCKTKLFYIQLVVSIHCTSKEENEQFNERYWSLDLVSFIYVHILYSVHSFVGPYYYKLNKFLYFKKTKQLLHILLFQNIKIIGIYNKKLGDFSGHRMNKIVWEGESISNTH